MLLTGALNHNIPADTQQQYTFLMLRCQSFYHPISVRTIAINVNHKLPENYINVLKSVYNGHIYGNGLSIVFSMLLYQ